MEEDDVEGGTDEFRVAPKIIVNPEEEVEDLNADLLTTD